ncbi:DUF7342 family protein [Haloarchaeobius salinus]|uniref:DUF7342 family protein n=1 Tax=Haloarchaeobius salinus TaxID=1198298 RepID=UPI00210CF228|nr:hypothetical protein [Haloarchaeobius salinus]
MAEHDASEESSDIPESFADSWTESLADRSTKERVYEVVTGLTEPAPVSEIADRADCSPGGARTNLEWLASMGVVDQTGSDPVLYERNEAYFDFLRVDRLTKEYSEAELDSRLDEYEARLAELTDELDGTDVDAGLLSEVPYDELEDTYEKLSEIRALRRRTRDIRRALLQLQQDDTAGNHWQPA